MSSQHSRIDLGELKIDLGKLSVGMLSRRHGESLDIDRL